MKEYIMSLFLKRIAAPLAVAACLGIGGSANAGVLTFQGVTFTSSFVDNVLRLEIDAANPTGDWSTATTLGMLGIKDVGSFSSVALTAAPPGGLSWMINTNELSANGCVNGANPMKICAFGSHLALTNDMVFEFTFTGGTQNFTSPFLKVGMYEGNSPDKVGSLLSMNIPAVPEPATYGMLLAGMALVGAVARKRSR
jgi:hypothetical protein